MDMQRLDKNVFSVGSLKEEPDEKSFWNKKTPLERLEATEIMRRINYGYDSATARLQRFFEVVTLKKS